MKQIRINRRQFFNLVPSARAHSRRRQVGEWRDEQSSSERATFPGACRASADQT